MVSNGGKLPTERRSFKTQVILKPSRLPHGKPMHKSTTAPNGALPPKFCELKPIHANTLCTTGYGQPNTPPASTGRLDLRSRPECSGLAVPTSRSFTYYRETGKSSIPRCHGRRSGDRVGDFHLADFHAAIQRCAAATSSCPSSWPPSYQCNETAAPTALSISASFTVFA